MPEGDFSLWTSATCTFDECAIIGVSEAKPKLIRSTSQELSMTFRSF
jgi:hypothetical protein